MLAFESLSGYILRSLLRSFLFFLLNASQLAARIFTMCYVVLSNIKAAEIVRTYREDYRMKTPCDKRII